MKNNADQVECESLLARMRRPIATVLGSGVPDMDSELRDMATMTGKLLVEAGYSVLTGGGPGVMDMVNAAASAHVAKDTDHIISAGVRVEGVDDAFECPSCHESIVVQTFGMRKRCLLAYCDICVVLPGGVGTADELWHVLNYIKHAQTACRSVILLPSHFWTYQMQWLQMVVTQGLVDARVADKVIAFDTVRALSDYLAE